MGKLILILVLSLSASAHSHPVVDAILPGSKQLGSAKLEYWTFDLYTASLYSVSGTFSWDSPFVLHLVYHRDVPGEKIADTTVKKIRKLG